MVSENSTPRWYAAYTRSNHEKSAAEQMGKRSIEHFVPTYEAVRTWKDRRMRLDRPLFPGYVFVRIALENRLKVLVVPGVVRLVGFDRQPAALPNEEIEMLRTAVNRRLSTEPHRYLTVGRRVRIVRGPLEGFEGVLLRRKGRTRLLLSLDLIRQSAAIEVDDSDVEASTQPRCPAVSNLASRNVPIL
jgi:transcription antitermination factor NusG